MLQHLTLHDHHLMIMDCLSNSMLDLLDTQIMLTSITLHIYQLLCKMLVIGENLGHCNWSNFLLNEYDNNQLKKHFRMSKSTMFDIARNYTHMFSTKT
jgi:hypothetical protein